MVVSRCKPWGPLLALLAPLALALCPACPRGPEALALSPDAGTPALPRGVILVAPKGGAPIPVEVELALDDASRQRGLMFRTSLEDGHGMLFVFERSRVQRFWMKNTLIPLDMIFAGDDGVVVGVVHEAAPLTTTSRFVPRPSRYVLEVPGGWARANGVGEGARLFSMRLPRTIGLPPAPPREAGAKGTNHAP